MIRCLLIFGLIWLSIACQVSESPPVPPTTAGGSASQAERPADKGALTPTTRPSPSQQNQRSFSKDILPLLSSNATGRVYKCTVCHRGYTDYEVVKSAYKKILTHAGPAGNMPLNGDKMSAEDLNIMLDWQREGFAP